MPSESSLKLYNYYINRFYDPKKIKKPKKFLTEISELKNRKGEEITVSTMKLIMCAIIWKLKTDKKIMKIIRIFTD